MTATPVATRTTDHADDGLDALFNGAATAHGEIAMREPGPDLPPVYDAADGTMRVPTPFGGILEFTAGQRVLTAEQMAVLAPIGIEAGWDPRVVAVFLSECNARQLDPWQREVYLMLYPGGKFIRHIGIDGFRTRGESTGGYRGRVLPVFCGDDGVWREVWPYRDAAPWAAKVGIHRAGFDGPVWNIAHYGEFVPMVDEKKWDPRQQRKVGTGVKVPSANWRTAADGGKPCVMTSKCAEAGAWRVAFPRRFSGLYAPEELERLRAEAGDDPATTARKAAYAAAQPAQRETIVVDSTVVDEDPAPDPADEQRVRRLVLAELDEQAEILGRSVEQMAARWSASREGQPLDTATVAELADFVTRWRPYVATALRDAGRDDEADRYDAAPSVGTVRELFGRGPAVVDPADVEATP